MRIPARLLPHQVTVERYEGRGAYGDIYAEPEVIDRVQVEEQQRLIRGPTGAEKLSPATIYLEIPEVPIKLGSWITRWEDTAYEVTSKVIGISVFQHPRGLSHMVLNVE